MTDANTTDQSATQPVPANADAAANKDGTTASAGEGDQGNADLYRPKDLPEHLLGKSDRETMDNITRAYKGARDEIGKKGKADAPESADAYDQAFPDDIRAQILRPGEDGKDEVFEKAKAVAHKHKMSTEAFSELVSEVLAAAQAKGPAEGGDGADDGEFAADFDFKDLGGAEKAKPEIEGMTVWLTGQKQNGKLSEDTFKELSLLTTHSQGLKALKELRGLVTGEKSIPARLDGNAPDYPTIEEIDARVNDEKYWRDKDPAFIDETTRLYQEYYSRKK